MKMLRLFFITMLFAVVVGCDGDGDAITPDTTTEETETVEEPTGPVTIATGSESVFPLSDAVIPFSIPETGVIKAMVEWNSPPSSLTIDLLHFSGVGESESSIQSPATLLMQATQDLLDNSNTWNLVVNNLTDESFTANYTVTFYAD